MEQYESVWDALEQDPAQAAEMKKRSELMIELRQQIDQNELTEAEAATLFNVQISIISALRNGKIDLFTVEQLNDMKTHAQRA